MKLIAPFLFGCLLLLCSLSAKAQSSTTGTKNIADTLSFKEKVAESQQLDTEESLRYMGSQLLFQVKKRLHLTDEKEEREQQNLPKTKKLSFFGIEIERE